MFREAIATARQFTAPVVLSRISAGGKCASSIGAFVVVNTDGWIVTAAHILEQLSEMVKQSDETKALRAKKQEIEADNSLSGNQKKKAIARLGRPHPDSTVHCSSWWGKDGHQLVDARAIGLIDLGVGRLTPFDPSWVPVYPVFKDPTKDYEPGTSLCKLGFPFHSITPTYDPTADTFRLPPGAVPLPMFPMDGIFTRVAEIVVDGAPPPPFPLQWLETSSPGLRGQSGGPIFDAKGTIWGIQVNTGHYPLGFNPPVPGKPNEKEYQFLNVGRGVHAQTILSFFESQGITYIKSAY